MQEKYMMHERIVVSFSHVSTLKLR